jgi:hypothetical protein
MGTHQRDQPLVREVVGRQCLVHVGRSCIPPRTLTIGSDLTPAISPVQE